MVVLPDPLAPMVVPPLVVVSVLAVPLGVVVVPLAAVSLLVLPLGVVVVAPAAGEVVVPVDAPAAPGAALESVVLDPLVPGLLVLGPLVLGVCAVAKPPIARAAAAASVDRVFLVVLISLLLERNPEGN